MDTLDAWSAVAVALAIGLLIGAERESSKHEVGSPGVRTFALAAVIGVLATMVPGVVSAVLLGGIGVMVAISYWASRGEDPGLTSESALLVTIALGALTATEPALAVGIAVTVTVLLMSKNVLHSFLHETVTELERTDALKFFVAAFIVLPLLPDVPIGPYDVLVPRRIWLLVVFITGIGWLGYAATRALGDRRGLLVAGLAGGFVSGTVTSGTMGSKYRNDGVPFRSALSGALAASISTLLQLTAVTVVIEPDVTVRLLPAVAAGGVVLALEAWLLYRGRGADGDHSATAAGRPFALMPALVLAAVISAVLVLSAWLTDLYGSAAVALISATSSLADFHASASAVSILVRTGDIAMSTAVFAIGMGLITNTVGKVVVATVGGGPRFGLTLAALLLPVAAAITAALVLVA